MSDNNENGNGKKLAWYDRKVKAKMAVVGLVLITISFYVTMFAGMPLNWFLYYAGFISLTIGTMTAGDVINTVSFNNKKNDESTRDNRE